MRCLHKSMQTKNAQIHISSGQRTNPVAFFLSEHYIIDIALVPFSHLLWTRFHVCSRN